MSDITIPKPMVSALRQMALCAWRYEKKDGRDAIVLHGADGVLRVAGASGFRRDVVSDRVDWAVAVDEAPPAWREVVSGSVLAKALHELRDDTIRIGPEPGHIVLTSADRPSRRVMLPISSRELDPAEAQPDAPSFDVDRRRLLRDLRYVQSFRSRDRWRPHLQGVLIHAVDGTLRVAATDSRRMALADDPSVLPEMPADLRITIPGPVVDSLMAALSRDTSDDVRIIPSPERVWIQTEGTGVSFRPVKPAFPDYQGLSDIMRTSSTDVVEVDRRELHRALRFVTPPLNKHSPMVRLSLPGPQDARMYLSSGEEWRGTGKVQESVPVSWVDGIEGRKVEVGLNYLYLGSLLRSWPGKTLVLGFAGMADSIQVTSPDHPEIRHVMMPMRLPEVGR